MPLNQKLNVLKTGINEWNHRMENLDETTDVMMGNWGKQTSWMVFGENKMLVWELIDVGGFKERPNWDAKMKYQQMSIEQNKVLFESTWTDNWTFWGNNNPFSFSQSVSQPASQPAVNIETLTVIWLAWSTISILTPRLSIIVMLNRLLRYGWCGLLGCLRLHSAALMTPVDVSVLCLHSVVNTIKINSPFVPPLSPRETISISPLVPFTNH